MDKQLIHNTEVEHLVLGTLMADRDALAQCGDTLHEDCFYDGVNRAIYRAIVAVADKGERPDPPTVLRRLQADRVEVTPYELAQVSANHTFDLAQHARYLADLAARRKFFDVASLLADNATAERDDVADVVAKAVGTLSSLLVASTDSLRTMSDGLQMVYDAMCRNISGEGDTVGIPTGFRHLDRHTGGLQKSDLVIIAGETSQGKTSFALSIVHHIAKQGRKAAIYSLEMNLVQLAARLVSMESGVPAKELLYFRLDEAGFKQASDGIGRLEGAGIYVDERSTANLESIVSSMHYLHMKHGVEVFVVDYLQLLTTRRAEGNTEKQTAEMARALKNAAKELDVTVIALSQLARNKDNPAPNKNRLRNSGQIEEAADTILLVYRPEAYKRAFPEPFDDRETQGYAYIEVAKGRNTGGTAFLCRFDAPTTRFSDVHLRDIPAAGMGRSNEKEMPF